MEVLAMTVRRRLFTIGAVAVLAAAGLAPGIANAGDGEHGDGHDAIKHLVIIYEENHSFDNLFGT
jgi:phospholipase C